MNSPTGAIATNKRISELLRDIDLGILVPKPPFQRRLVWTNIDKERFLETILLGLPFPEIFIASGAVDTETLMQKNLLVDGQQRISTLSEYVRGSKDLILKSIPRFADLDKDKKSAFLSYGVVVRDLGQINEENVKVIFARINSTDFALNAVERVNALYSGCFKVFCDELSRHQFFVQHEVFSAAMTKRMRDLDFCIILVATSLSTYYHRDRENQNFLKRYNDSFEIGDQVKCGLERVFKFIEQCGLESNSRAWKTTDLLTLLIEVYSAIEVQKLSLVAKDVGISLNTFYSQVDELNRTIPQAEAESVRVDSNADVFRYLQAATKASNDKYSRMIRAEIISGILLSCVSSKSKRIRSQGPKKMSEN